MSKYIRLLPLALILGGMITLFAIELPHLHIDLATEVDYLLPPYMMIVQKHIHVTDADPFVENGPHAVLPPAAIVYYTHSLVAMRTYFFLYSLILMSLLYWLFLRATNQEKERTVMLLPSALVMFTAWITIPLILIYPIQTNGMTPGFVCFLLGLILNKRHPYGAMLLFGLAYSFKGQFLALLPGIMVYKAFFERSQPLKTHLGYLVISLALFFVPATIVITGVVKALGWFDDRHDLIVYAFRAPAIFWSEFSMIAQRFSTHAPPPDAQAVMIRHKELAGYGLVTWVHIGLSIAFSLTLITRRLRGRWVTPSDHARPAEDALTLFAFAALPYWFHFFFFWRYPYWYNVLPVIFFNIFIIPFVFFKTQEWIEARLNQRLRLVFVCAAVYLGLLMIVRHVRHAPGIADRSTGDSLTPFAWMRS